MTDTNITSTEQTDQTGTFIDLFEWHPDVVPFVVGFPAVGIYILNGYGFGDLNWLLLPVLCVIFYPWYVFATGRRLFKKTNEGDDNDI